jgi:hypothetical protein
MPALAGIRTYEFTLDGLQENPPVATPATGDCTVTLDDVSFAVNLNCTFSGLIGTANNAHIHGLAPVGTNTGVILPLSFTAATSGTITGNGILTAVNAQGMIDGLTYVNLHSTFRPGGEIRGQIVPEPTSLMMLGLGSLIVMRRRR